MPWSIKRRIVVGSAVYYANVYGILIADPATHKTLN